MEAVGQHNIKTPNAQELINTEKEITMSELEHCLIKPTTILPLGFIGAFYKAFWATLKHLVLRTINKNINNN